MNKIELKKKAINLKIILSKYSKSDAEAESLLFGLLPLINDAIAEKNRRTIKADRYARSIFFQ